MKILYSILLFLLFSVGLCLECSSGQVLLTLERHYDVNPERESFLVRKFGDENQIFYAKGSSTDTNKNYTYEVCLQSHTLYEIRFNYLVYITTNERWPRLSYVSANIQGRSIFNKARCELLFSAIVFRSTYDLSCDSSHIESYIHRQYAKCTTSKEGYVLYKNEESVTNIITQEVGTNCQNQVAFITEICLERDTNYLLKMTESEDYTWYVSDYTLPSSISIYSVSGTIYVPFVRKNIATTLYYKFSTKENCANNESPITIHRQALNYFSSEYSYIYQESLDSSILVWGLQGRELTDPFDMTYTVCMPYDQQYTLILGYSRTNWDWWETSSISIHASDYSLVPSMKYINNGQNTILFTVPQLNSICHADGEFPAALRNTNSTLSCLDGYSGSRTRYCDLDGLAEEINTCTLIPPTSFKYKFYFVSIYINNQFSMLPTYTGLNVSFSITPSLPEGFSISSVTGEISGSSSQTYETTEFIITCSNTGGSANFYLKIEILTPPCPFDNNWPETRPGRTVTAACVDAKNYAGYRSRTCKDDATATWLPVIDNCILIFASISYSKSQYTYIKGISSVSLTPTLRGGLLNPITVSPSLPTGLTLDTQTGKIQGTPMIGTDSVVYHITASNARNSQTFNLTLLINVSYCPETDILNRTEAGITVERSCLDSINYEGLLIHQCSLSSPATWSLVSDTCQLIPAYISYKDRVVIGYKNDTIETMIPDLRGGLLNPLIIKPDLPEGIFMDPRTGIISGTTNSITSQSYVITATNIRSSSNTIITITISEVYCSQRDDVLLTERGSITYLNCPNNMKGFQTLACLYAGYNSAIWSEPNINNCIQYSESDTPDKDKVFIHIPLRMQGITKDMFDTSYTSGTFINLIFSQYKYYTIQESDILIESTTALYEDSFQVIIRFNVLTVIKDLVINEFKLFANQYKDGQFETIMSCSNHYLCSVSSLTLEENQISVQSYYDIFFICLYVLLGVIIIVIVVVVVLLLIKHKNKKPHLSIRKV